MESVPPRQWMMSDGLVARWTPPCQCPFTSCRCSLICLMTNDLPYEDCVCVCKCVCGGLFHAVQGVPPTLQKEQEQEGGGKVSEETRVIERGQRGRSGSGHQETCTGTHTLWQDLFKRHRYPSWPLWVDCLHHTVFLLPQKQSWLSGVVGCSLWQPGRRPCYLLNRKLFTWNSIS